ncbi:uncharacterized protein H6S33_002513 [Morchella sextelata]|uniref:uncharacterized protein n=1 Tax=Morchella sextelata TaxID=1174677 RepID=UPI001D04DB00|nr:uncharacterized protein H6S33_002513 [Morchella sextelata]KAH0607479.1 hypothetical protein H6S33_002513 [Morchella sextelata]
MSTTDTPQTPTAMPAAPPPSSPTPQRPARPRKNTTFEQLDRPGSVRINVRGAFIDSEEPLTPPRTGSPPRGPVTKDIRLPHHKADVSHIAVDIGGSLAKLVYFSREPNGEGGKLSFKNFETERIEELVAYMGGLVNGKRGAKEGEEGDKGEDVLYVMATGGGAFKFYDEIKEALGVEIYREDEMECLIIGLDFFITEIPEEVFTYSEANPMAFAAPRPDIYPYLLVNIGSGVSMIKVSGPQQYTRIGGSSLGGGTLWGLLSLLTQAKSFDEMLGMAECGDNTKVDMLVGDIYGGGYGKVGLKSNTIASSFGKVFKKKREGEQAAAEGEAEGADGEGAEKEKGGPRFREEDISRSLLYAVSNNIGQIAYLQAQNHGLEHIYFGGSFIRGHRQTMNTLSYAIKFWSQGEQKAYFLRHEGYLGAVGAFLRRQPRNWGRRYSAGEEHGGRRVFTPAKE